MSALQLFASAAVDSTGAGEVRVGDLVMPRDFAIAYAVRLLDAAHVAARELPPGTALEVERARKALGHLDQVFRSCVEVRCKVDGEGVRHLPGVRLDRRRGLIRVGALATALVLRHQADRSWSGFMQVWGLASTLDGAPVPELDPGFRRVRADYRQIGAAPCLRLEAR